MRRILSADKVKKLPAGTGVFVVREKDGKQSKATVIQYGRQKKLQGEYLHAIKDQPGFHYEVEE